MAATLRASVEGKEMSGVFGLSIDAKGKARRVGCFREAVSITKVNSKKRCHPLASPGQ